MARNVCSYTGEARIDKAKILLLGLAIENVCSYTGEARIDKAKILLLGLAIEND